MKKTHVAVNPELPVHERHKTFLGEQTYERIVS
jgi:hypothetical protein